MFLPFFQIFLCVIGYVLKLFSGKFYIFLFIGIPEYHVAILICAFSYSEWDSPLSYFYVIFPGM